MFFDLTQTDKQQINHWQGLVGSAQTLALVQFAQQQKRCLLLLAADTKQAAQWAAQIKFWSAKDLPVLQMPDWEVLPYDSISPHQEIISRRLKTLRRCQSIEQGIVIVTLETASQRLCPVDFLKKHSRAIAVGEHLDLTNFCGQLQKLGYGRVVKVQTHGEFAVRGSIIDVFTMGADKPFRLDLFDNEVESICFFDVENQRSGKKLTHIDLLPAKEFGTDDASIARFLTNYHSQFGAEGNALTQALENKQFTGGIEFYLPFFFDETATIFDYINNQALVVATADLSFAFDKLAQQTETRYQQISAESDKALLRPPQLFLSKTEFFSKLKNHKRLQLSSNQDNRQVSENFATKLLPALSVQSQTKKPWRRLFAFMSSFKGRILFVMQSLSRQQVLIEALTAQKIALSPCQGWQDFLQNKKPYLVSVGLLDQGLLLANVAVITETELFGTTLVRQQKRRRAKHKDFTVAVKDLIELGKGDAVVHERFGVGRFLGLETIVCDEQSQDFVGISYADDAKLMVPITALHLISRYSGIDSRQAPLHRLGSGQWQKAKSKTIKALHDVAVELLETSAKRQYSTGAALKPTSDGYSAFVSEFSFEETPDQETAIAQMLADMQKTKPMDRLICGDVGFGKTEIAMRAAFLTAESGQQVAVLVPTTLLASQHLTTFSNRFANYAINIASLSRFNNAKQQQETSAKLKNGQVDIVVGTHKLLSDKIVFANLGLVIIDEEHRFGVRQKERFKALRSQVNVLTMTATPIPRTLSMALGELKDLSIIATPPKKRVAIKTFMTHWQAQVIQEACWRELRRGGQIFIVHNDIDSIDLIAEEITRYLPNVLLRIAHGKMPEQELARVMGDFYHQKFHILVCTTIIETGIDVPNANTIIINNAQNFGLAQLHQLRGRVGRAHHQAYAYLMIKPMETLTDSAQKRLRAISAQEALGAGFMLANHDLEIRGAGELLGEGQSGKIQAVGFSLYYDLLKRTIAAIKDKKTLDADHLNQTKTDIDLALAMILPADYIDDPHERLLFYKQISGAQDQAQLEEIHHALIDRFGLLPQAAKNLFAVATLRQKTTALAIEKITANKQKITFVFADKPNINTSALIDLLQKAPQTYRFDGKKTLVIAQKTDTETRLPAVTEQVRLLS